MNFQVEIPNEVLARRHPFMLGTWPLLLCLAAIMRLVALPRLNSAVIIGGVVALALAGYLACLWLQGKRRDEWRRYDLRQWALLEARRIRQSRYKIVLCGGIGKPVWVAIYWAAGCTQLGEVPREELTRWGIVPNRNYDWIHFPAGEIRIEFDAAGNPRAYFHASAYAVGNEPQEARAAA